MQDSLLSSQFQWAPRGGKQSPREDCLSLGEVILLLSLHSYLFFFFFIYFLFVKHVYFKFGIIKVQVALVVFVCRSSLFGFVLIADFRLLASSSSEMRRMTGM